MIGRKTPSEKTTTKVSMSGPTRQIIMRLIKEGGILLLVVGGLFAVSGFLSGLADDEKRRRDRVETETLQIAGNLQTLKTQMSEYIYALPLSEKLLNAQGRPIWNLSRDAASEMFFKLHEKHSLNDVKVTISSIEPFQDNTAHKQHIQMIRSTIDVNIHAFSDEQIAAYINDVVAELPGVVDVGSFEMARGDPYTFNAIQEEKSLTTPQIKTTLNFIWYGLESKEKNTPNNAAGGF